MNVEIKNIMKSEDLEKLGEICVAKFVQSDTGKSGIMKVSDFRKVLLNATQTGGFILSDIEMIKICKDLPRDPYGRSLCATFGTVLKSVRHNTLKQELLELQGNFLQKNFIEECKKMEENIFTKNVLTNILTNKFNHTGLLHFEDLFIVLKSSLLVGLLTKFQIFVILSDAVVVNDKIDYYLFVPYLVETYDILVDGNTHLQKETILQICATNFDIHSVKQV